MKILKNFFSSLLVFFLFSIFFALINSPSTYASSSVRYWSYTDWSATYEGHTTYPIKISKGSNTDKLMTQNAVCIEAGYNPPGYSARTTNLGTLYEDDEIWEKEPDFYYFAQKLYSNYGNLNTITGTSYDSFAIAHMALSRKHKNHLCNIGSKKCTNIVDKKIVKKIDELGNPTTCYKMYLVENESSQDAFYADTGTTVTCPETAVTNSTFTPYVTVSDGTTTGNSSSHNSTSKAVTISKANSFSNFTLTFTGSITRSGEYAGAATIKYGMAESSPSASTDLSSFPKNDITNTVTVSQSDITAGSSKTYCRTLKIAPSTVSSDGTTSGNKTATVCAKVTRAADEKKSATFSGAVTATTASSSGFSEETTTSSDKKTITYYTYKASGTAKVKVSGTITRGTPSDDIGGNKSSRFNFTTSAQTSSPYGIGSSSSTSGDLAAGGKADKNAEISVTWSSLDKGEETSLGCGYLYLDTKITYTNGTEDSNGRTQGAASSNGTYCVKVKRYSNDEATFEGTTAHKNPDGETSYVDTGGKVTKCTLSKKTYSCDGVASEGSYSFLFTNSLKRTDSNSKISSSVCKYQVRGKTVKDGSSNSRDCQLASNKTKTGNTLGQHEVTISVTNSDTEAGEETYCDYVSYAPKVYYYNGSFDSFATSVNSNEKCVKVTRPKNVLTQAEYTGGIKITDNNGNVLDCTNSDLTTASAKLNKTIKCNGPAVSSDFDLTFEYTITRKSDDSYPKSLKTKVGTSLYNGAFSDSRYPSTISNTDDAFNKGDTKTIQKEESKKYTIKPGKNKTICAYLKYNSAIYFRNGSERSDKDRDVTKVYKCIKISNPDPSTAISFTGKTNERTDSDKPEVLDSDYFTETNTNVWYITDPLVLSSNNKYRIRFTHVVKRNNVSNYSSSDEKLYVTSDVPNIFNPQVRYASGTSASSAGWEDRPGVSWSEDFSITAAGVGASKTKKDTISVYLPAGTKKTYCERVSYDSVVTIKYSTQSVITPTTRSNSAEKCLTLANPIYQYKWDDISYNTDITISGTSTLESLKYVGTGEQKFDFSSDSYTLTKAKNMVAYFSHTIKRGNDNYTRNKDKVSPSYAGNVKKGTGSYKNYNSGTVSSALGPNDTWKTPSSSQTHTLFSAFEGGITPPQGIRIAAGETVRITSRARIQPKKYRIPYGTQYWREHYTDETPDTSWIVYKDRRNLRVPSDESVADCSTYNAPEPDPDNPSVNTTAAYVDLYRPYNFKVGEIAPTGDGEILDNPGSSISISFSIPVTRNTDAHPAQKYITDLDHPKVKVVSFVIDKNTSLNNAGLIAGGVRADPNTDNGFCNLYTRKSGTSCNVYLSDTADLSFSHKDDDYYSGTSYEETFTTASIVSPSNLSVGDKFCIAIALYKAADDNPDWVVSKAYCATSAKKPTMQVWGNSVFATGGVNTSYTEYVPNSRHYGSWTDFALIAGGTIKKMASGASLEDGRRITDEANTCIYSPLTIANNKCAKTSGSALGQANVTSRSPIVDNLFKRYATLASENDSYKLPGTSIYKRTVGNTTIIYSSSSSTNYQLTNDNTYNPQIAKIGYSSFTQIPQVLILSETGIDINKGVTNIDAWLIARGNITTCAGYSPTSSNANSQLADETGRCGQQLKLNAPIFANNINFYRTYGGDYSSLSTPAELLDYNTGALLWSYAQSTQTKVPQTVYLKELSPRYQRRWPDSGELLIWHSKADGQQITLTDGIIGN